MNMPILGNSIADWQRAIAEDFRNLDVYKLHQLELHEEVVGCHNPLLCWHLCEVLRVTQIGLV